MEKIKSFLDFHNDILYVFDFDDTLAESPSFEDIALKYINENITVKILLDNLLKSIGANKSDLKYENGRLFISDKFMEYPEKRNWIRKGERLYLTTPDIFCKMEESLPKKVLGLIELYNKVENKCIVTARPESLRFRITSLLKELNINFPKYGLHMCPDGRLNAGMWKGEKIAELAKKHQFNNVIFYDDNAKYIKKATKAAKEIMPNLILQTVKVPSQVS